MHKSFRRLRKFCDWVAVVICPSFRRKPESRFGWVVAMETGFRPYDKKTNIGKNDSLLPSLSHIWLRLGRARFFAVIRFCDDPWARTRPAHFLMFTLSL
jgi:hypothetical protein